MNDGSRTRIHRELSVAAVRPDYYTSEEHCRSTHCLPACGGEHPKEGNCPSDPRPTLCINGLHLTRILTSQALCVLWGPAVVVVAVAVAVAVAVVVVSG
ncbi:hypothetical protein E2C01_077389 [Portunus trituberculatus]|uniref:Uncharacterized protein n=1 Tax=Portunus trituberculatus TaxID=210409 RepID=A0A5B7ILA2_PORTR|nr:hypothetical protein [Portunus trituberculatus]